MLREIPEDASLRQQWDALLSRVEQPQVFYTYEWALAVYRAYGASLRPWLFLVHDGQDSLSGVAALAADTTGKQVSFLCATTGDYCDFLSAADQRPALVKAVLGQLKAQGIERLTLTNLPADSATIPALREAAQQHKFLCHMRTAYVCAQVALDTLERRGDHNPVLPRKKMLRRFLNAMGRENPVRLDHSRSCGAIHAVLPEFIQSHVARFLVTGRISNMARPERRQFLAELAKLLSDSGSVVLTRMMSGDRVFAWNYGFQFQGTWFWYQPAFDSDLEKYSPGFCLLAKVIEEAADNPALRIVDLGLGAEDYKERFANRTRETLFVSLRTSVLEHYREIMRDWASSAVRASREVELAVRSVLGWLERIRKSGASGALRGTARWLGSLLWSSAEICFYEWCGPIRQTAGTARIQRMELHHLASAVLKYADDEETLSYLLRSTRRLRSENGEGFVLLDPAGTPLHFAWASSFERTFVLAWRGKVEAPSPEDVLLSGCWTPAPVRGRGYGGQALELIAGQLSIRGKRAWTFSGTAGEPWIRALKKAGFRQRYALVRRSVLGRKTINFHPLASQDLSHEEVSARV